MNHCSNPVVLRKERNSTAPTPLFLSMLTSTVVVASEGATSTAFQEPSDQAEVHGHQATHLFVARMLTTVLSWQIPNTTARANLFTAKQPSFQFVPSKELIVVAVTKPLNLVTLAHNKMLLFQSQKERLALSKSKLVEVSLHSNPTTLTVLILLFWTTTMMILQPKVQEFFKLNLNQIHHKIVTKINHETKMMMANLVMFHKTLDQSK